MCIYKDMYTSWDLKGAPHTDPGDAGAQAVPRGCSAGAPSLPRTPPSGAAGPRVTAGGAGAPRGLRPAPLPPAPPARAFPSFPRRSPARTLESSLIAPAIVAWGRGAPHLETSRAFLSLSVPAFWSLKHLQRFCLF